MKDDVLKVFGCIGILALSVLIVALGPLLSIWALNTLFPVLVIPYTLATWFAVLWIFGGVGGIVTTITKAINN